MQTFLVYEDFVESARILDRARLGKQRVECLQIMRIVTGQEDSRWRNHPAVLMWREHSFYLIKYSTAICKEWISRGYKDSCLMKIDDVYEDFILYNEFSTMKPYWLGDERLHSSHRAALLAKNYEWYSRFGWTEEAEIDYYWPVRRYKSTE